MFILSADLLPGAPPRSRPQGPGNRFRRLRQHYADDPRVDPAPITFTLSAPGAPSLNLIAFA
ncbi:hypothetical protein [Flexivirga sp. B27]